MEVHSSLQNVFILVHRSLHFIKQLLEMEWLGEHWVSFLLEHGSDAPTGCQEDHWWNVLGNNSPSSLDEVQEIQRSCQYSTKIYIEQDKRREAKSTLSDPREGWHSPSTTS